jgi:NitT/TauT family transport system permease protein
MIPTASSAANATKKRRRGNSLWGLYLLSICLGFALWFLAAVLDGAQGILPTPIEVASTAWSTLMDGTLLANISASLSRVLIGFLLGVILSIPAGFLMGWYRLARGLIEPWMQFLRTIPPIALTPLIILLLGIGEVSKIFLIFLAAFLASTISTFQGVRNVDLTLIKAARVLGARDRTIFLEIVVPAAFPYILVGMRIALGSAWSTLVASELIGSNSGLGYMMQNAALYFQTSSIMLGIIVIGVLGFLMDRALLALERRLTAWQEKQS